ncbi:MAG: PhnD/SsuA/transferrin family substrate-binding protein [Ilumatobacteraceae bacterium]
MLLSPRECDLADLVSPDVHAVANSADSLSGWLSLLAATVGVGGDWPGTVTYTSAHVDSLRALAKGEADLACIDSWSLALISREEPELVAGLNRVGYGPLVPTPAITARKSISLGQLDDLRSALAGALDDDTTADARAALYIAGLAGTTLDDYLTTLSLGPGR